eukprot:TRINITY_DN7937_c0_g1_i1.p1 TRINITY_DN7937_c0_g1~~TRINITY_DN7937_c0_g1_i1.p1  ORF type:complete len:327 (-),score=29.54 TRINITY_DN7937_c0_g1_i1:4-984(-)
MDIVVFSSIPNIKSAFLNHPTINSLPSSSQLNFSFYNPKDQNFSETEFHASLKDCSILVIDPRFHSYLPPELPKLKWAQCVFAGVDRLYPIKSLFSKCPLTRLGGVMGAQMSVYCTSHILFHERRFLEYKESKQWILLPVRNMKVDPPIVGIMGIGDLGSSVGRSLYSFGFKIWGLCRDKSRRFNYPFVEKLFETTELVDFISGVDYLVNLMPNTSKTRGLLSGDVLSKCKPNCMFINVGRGSIIKEVDLINALEKKWIAAAVLDVFEVEPLPETSKLWQMRNVTITPHISAQSYPEDVADIFFKNLEHFLKNEALEYVVNLELEY